MTNPFGNPLARGGSGIIDKAAPSSNGPAVIELSDNAIVSGSEIARSLPGHPPKQTVVLVMIAGQRKHKASLHATLTDVERPQLTAALRNLIDGDSVFKLMIPQRRRHICEFAAEVARYCVDSFLGVTPGEPVRPIRCG